MRKFAQKFRRLPRHSRFKLAIRAEVRRSSAENDALNLSPADAARLARAIVDFMLKLKPTGFTVGIAVIPQRAAAMIDRLLENRFDRAIQRCDLCIGQSVGGDEGMDTGGEEGFIDIDVPQAGDQRLIEQCGFDRPAGSGKLHFELRRA